jgi:glycosyltransferase involved in cell wall biosynthesis
MRAFHLLRRLGRKHAITLVALGAPDDPSARAAVGSLCERVIGLPGRAQAGSRLGLRGLLSPVPRYHVQTESPAMRALALSLAPGHDAAIGLQVSAARYLADLTRLPRVFEEVEVTAIRERWTTAATARARVRHGLTWWKARHFVRRIVTSVERATVVSSLERQALIEMGCDSQRIAVVPNGVEITNRPRANPGGARLIYPGSVQFDCNLDAVRYFVRDVWPLIRQARPDASFWVTGATDGVDIADLRQPGVTFTGCVPEVEPAIAGSIACVVPLRLGGGTRLKVLQAMALGVPVVSTPKGVEGLDVDAGEHVLVGRAPGQLAANVLRLLAEPALAARLSAAAHARVCQSYSWDAIVDSLDAVIRDAVYTRGGARRPAWTAPAAAAR